MNFISKEDKSTQALLCANLLPMFGVLFLHWSVLEILYIYWLETLVIGIITAIKMLKTKIMVPDKSTKEIPATPLTSVALRLSLIGFFIIHYGGFLFGYFLFIFGAIPAIFNSINPASVSSHSMLGIFVSGIGLFVSHWLSYKQNFIGKNEFKKTNIISTMFAPYKRIVVLHLTIIFGIFLVIFTTIGISIILSSLNFDGTKLLSTALNSVVLVLFIYLKIIVDKKYHLQEHFDMELKQTL